MAAKKVRVAPASSSSWVTLPGNTADFSSEADMVDDTIFGHSYKSEQSDILMWSVSANAFYKGYAGYQAVIKKAGSAVSMTAQATTLVSGKTYQISDATKRIISVLNAVTVLDNAVDHTSDVESIDYLWGKVTFKSAYTVTGPVTITGYYIPVSQICAMNKYSLTQQAEAVDSTDLCIAQSNGGYRQYTMGLKTVALELSGFYKTSTGFLATLAARSPVVVELNPDGAGKSVARGFFTPKADKQSGKAGSLEEETLSFSLYVPSQDLLVSPFSWTHAVDTTLNTGIQTLLSAWQSGDSVEARYLEDGSTGKQGSAIPTNLSMSGGLGTLNEFSVQLRGTGAITAV